MNINRLNITVFSLFLLFLTLAACEEIKVYEEEPSVSFKEFRYEDTTLLFEFIDGDGDLGLDQFDTIEPFNVNSKYYHNLFITYYEYEDGEFTEIEFKFPPNYRFGVIPTPEGNNKTLKGEMEIRMKDNFPMPPPDSFMITFYIVDRALHESNADSSDILTFRELEKIIQ